MKNIGSVTQQHTHWLETKKTNKTTDAMFLDLVLFQIQIDIEVI